MAKNNSASERFSELRQRAENALQKRPSDSLAFAQLSRSEIHSLIHELQVRQLELEMQNG